MNELFKVEKNKNNKYKGLVFRAYESSYYCHINKKIEFKIGFRLLKKKSSLNVASYFMLDEMSEMLDSGSVFYQDAVDNGKLYGIRIINESRDYESGIIDDYQFEFFKLDDK